MLVSDVITSALSRIGVIPIGGTIPAEWTTLCIVELNRLLQHWAAVNLFPAKVVKGTYTLSAGTAIYTVGTGEAINVARPTRIVAASVTLNSIETPCDVYHGLSEYMVSPGKEMRGRPMQVFYDPGITQGTLSLSPIPDGAYSLALWNVSALTAVTLATDTVTVPVDFEYVVTVVFSAHLMSIWGKYDEFLAKEAMLALESVMPSRVAPAATAGRG
jgi:hypothetical protein